MIDHLAKQLDTAHTEAVVWISRAAQSHAKSDRALTAAHLVAAADRLELAARDLRIHALEFITPRDDRSGAASPANEPPPVASPDCPP